MRTHWRPRLESSGGSRKPGNISLTLGAGARPSRRDSSRPSIAMSTSNSRGPRDSNRVSPNKKVNKMAKAGDSIKATSDVMASQKPRCSKLHNNKPLVSMTSSSSNQGAGPMASDRTASTTSRPKGDSSKTKLRMTSVTRVGGSEGSSATATFQLMEFPSNCQWDMGDIW